MVSPSRCYFFGELNVSVHWLKFRETCCTVVAVCTTQMCTYGLKRYFHFTWNTTLLIKVWLDVIFKSLGCNQQVSLLFHWGVLFDFFFSLDTVYLLGIWFNCASQPSLGCGLWGSFGFTPRLSCLWLSLGFLDTMDRQPCRCDTKAGWRWPANTLNSNSSLIPRDALLDQTITLCVVSISAMPYSPC